MEKKPPFFRTPYNYDTNKASDESALKCADKTRTQQHFADDADINVIVKRFGLTGQLPQGVRMPQYADFEEAIDFQTAMNAIRAAQESFDAMPANVRARFHNDPGEFVDFVANEENRAEAEKLGLVLPKTKLHTEADQDGVLDDNKPPKASPGTPKDDAKVPPKGK